MPLGLSACGPVVGVMILADAERYGTMVKIFIGIQDVMGSSKISCEFRECCSA